MSDEKKLPPGSTLNVTLRRKQKRRPPARPSPADPIATGGEGSQGGARGIVPLDDDGPQLYVRRGGKSALSFFDLGTRLRSVPGGFSPLEFRPTTATDTPTPQDGYFNEYVEIETHFAGIYTEDGATRRLTLTPDEHAAYTRALLGSLAPGDPAPIDPLNPLGSSPANVTGRSLSNCENLAYDVPTLFQMGVRVGTKQIDFSQAFKFREATEADASERWNPLNLLGFSTPHEGHLETKDVRGALKVESAWLREFDTGDTVNYKVTSAPVFASDDAPFSMNDKPVSVYLVPALSAYQLTTGGADNEPVAQLATRALSSYPYGTEANGGDVTGCLLRRTPLAGLVGGAGSYLRPELTNPGPGRSLPAVIVRDGGRFYVWRRTDAGASPLAVGGTLPGCDG